MKYIAKILSFIFSPFIGKFNWTPPKWMTGLANIAKKKPLFSLLFLVVLWGGIGGYAYWKWMPKPAAFLAVIDAPAIPSILGDAQDKPTQLYVNFQANTEMQKGDWPSPANIQLLEQNINQYVSLVPQLEGEWRWLNEQVVSFTPSEHWPADTKYTVTLDKDLFAKGVKLENNTAKFSTRAFTAKLYNTRFYKDPLQPGVHKAIASIEFSHPVTADNIKPLIDFYLRDNDVAEGQLGKALEMAIELEENQRRAHIHSNNIKIKSGTQTANISLREGKIGNNQLKLETALNEKIFIPDVSQYFRVTQAKIDIIPNEQGQPEQVFSVTLTDKVANNRLTDFIEILAVPKPPKKSRWRSAGEVSLKAREKASKVDLSGLVATSERFNDRYNFVVDIPEQQQLLISVKQGLQSETGFTLNTRYEKLLNAPNYPKEAKIMGNGGVVSLSGAQTLGFQARGLNALRVKLGKVLPGQLNHLISQTSGDLENPSFENWAFNENNISDVEYKVLRLNKKHPKEAQFASLDLSEWLKTYRSDVGLFFISVAGWDTNREYNLTPKDSRLVLVTNLGLLSKQNANQSRELFVQSFSTGRPVIGANIKLLAQNGTVLAKRKTDVKGHAHFSDVSHLSGAKMPVVYVAEHNGDISYLPYYRYGRELDISRFDIGGHYRHTSSEQQLSAQVFSDRGIYRPGETAHFATIVKDFSFNTVEGLPLRFIIRDPRGRNVFKKSFSLDASGMQDTQFDTQLTSATGQYYLQLEKLDSRGRVDDVLGSTTFSVEEFQADTMKIRSKITPSKAKGWVEARQLVANVELQNLFGTPAQNRRVLADLTLTPSSFAFKAWPEFNFNDPYAKANDRQRFTEALDEQTSNAAGQANFNIDLSRYDEGAWRVELFTEGYEADGGNSVSAVTSTLVSPAKYLIGYKADADFSYLKLDSDHVVTWQAIDSNLAPVSIGELTLRLNQRQYISTLVKQPDGTYAYQSALKRQHISDTAISVEKTGLEYPLPTSKAGSYEFDVLDAQERLLSRVSFTVIGAGNLTASLEKNAELDIKLNQADYAAGDSIEIAVTAPYKGAGLITIESDSVHHWKWFKADSNTSIQTIRIPKHLEGNAYVSVAFVRSIDSPSIFNSPLSYAVAPFNIDRSRRKVDIKLNTPDTILPGEILSIDYQTDRPSKIVVFAVDEGILQVSNYRTPNPLSHFFRKRALQVSTQQMADLLMPEYQLIRDLAAPGGGAMMEAAADLLGANLNPFQRKVRKPVAFWSGLLTADAQQRSVEFALPEHFNGRLRIMAVAAADGAVGSTKDHSLVRSKIILQPRLLNAASPGDEFNVTINLANIWEGSGSESSVNLAVKANEHIELLSAAPEALKIAEGSEQAVTLKFKALDKLGNGEIKFLATANHPTLGSTTAKRTETVSIRPASAYQHSFQSGVINDAVNKFELANDIYPEFAKRNINISSSPLVLTSGLQAYLDQYLYGCTEQVVSKAVPVLALTPYPELLDATNAEISEQINTTLTLLAARQTSAGGFGLWPGDEQVAIVPTLHAVHFLLDAQAAEFSVNKSMLNRAIDYLKRYTNQGITSLVDARQRSYAIYLLTRHQIVAANQLTELHEFLKRKAAEIEPEQTENQYKLWQNDIVAAYMGAAYQLLQKTNVAQSLINGYEFKKATPKHGTFYDSALSQNAQVVYLMARHFPEQAKNISTEELTSIAKPINEGQYHSYSAASAISGLAAYSQLVSLDTDSSKIAISAADKTGAAVDINTENDSVFTLAQLPYNSKNITVNNADKKPLFYTLNNAGFNSHPNESSTAEGIEIIREYLNAEGKASSQFTQGDKVTVRLRVRALKKALQQVAIMDLLPGGLMAERESLRKGQQFHHIDIREDRVLFYSDIGLNITTIEYQATVSASGKFTVPPAYAEAMYDREVRALSAAATIQVIDK